MHGSLWVEAVSVLLAAMISLQDHDTRLVGCVSYPCDGKFVEFVVDAAIVRLMSSGFVRG